MSTIEPKVMISGETSLGHTEAVKTSDKHHPAGPPCELMDILGQMVHTGYMFRVPLPFGAENGPVPLFAFRWGPDVFIPNIKMWTRYLSNNNEPADGFNWLSDPAETNQVFPRGYSGTPTKNVEMHFNGSQPVHSLFALLYRLNRMDIQYSLRMNGNYAGSGLILVTTAKGIPRWAGQISGSQTTFPNTLFSGGPQIGASMQNSSVQLDSSKGREISFFYPYEFPYEFNDVVEDLLYDKQYSDDVATNPVNTSLVDNYFIVSARNTLAAPDNTSHIDIYVDFRFVNPVFRIPLLPYLGLFKAWIPAMTTPSGKSVVAIVNQQTTTKLSEKTSRLTLK